MNSALRQNKIYKYNIFLKVYIYIMVELST